MSSSTFPVKVKCNVCGDEGYASVPFRLTPHHIIHECNECGTEHLIWSETKVTVRIATLDNAATKVL